MAPKGLPIPQEANIQGCKMQNSPMPPKGRSKGGAESTCRWQLGGCSWRGGVPEEFQGRAPGLAGAVGLNSACPARVFHSFAIFFGMGLLEESFLILRILKKVIKR